MAKHFAPGGGMNANMMKQVQKMQQDMLRTQEEIENRTFTSAAGGGAVSVSVNGRKELTSLTLSADVVDPTDIEMLQDLIISATNAAIKEADDTMSKEMNRFTGGLNLPF